MIPYLCCLSMNAQQNSLKGSKLRKNRQSGNAKMVHDQQKNNGCVNLWPSYLRWKALWDRLVPSGLETGCSPYGQVPFHYLCFNGRSLGAELRVQTTTFYWLMVKNCAESGTVTFTNSFIWRYCECYLNITKWWCSLSLSRLVPL